MERKMITEKQIACIKKNKWVIDDNKVGNSIDKIELNNVTRYDASKIIGGLLMLVRCRNKAFNGYKVSNSSEFLGALDDVFDTIDKYKTVNKD